MSSKAKLTRADRKRRKKREKKPRPANALTISQRRFAAEIGRDFDALDDAERGALFEYFATFHILRRFHAQEIEPLSLETLTVSAQDEGRVDTAALLIAGHLVRSVDEIETALEMAEAETNVDIIAIRASRANRFDENVIIQFGLAVDAMVRAAVPMRAHASDRSPAALLSHIRAWGEAAGLKLNIRLFSYYSALGKWDDESDAAFYLREARANLAEADWICDTEIETVDRSRLLDMIASGGPATNPLSNDPIADDYLEEYEAELPLEGLVPLPNIPGVGGGYFGSVPVWEFLDLLEREDGQGLREAIFTQNVRGYQGDGGVNERIRATLASPDRAQFLLRNNGVTVVADEIDLHGDRVHLRNFQIVNGLQTSTVLYRMRDEIRDADDIFVPIKLVAARDWHIRRSIIEATNRQTPITGAALFAAGEKALDLEKYFKERVAAGAPPLFLERRRGQYASTMASQKISLEDLLRVFYAVFLELPQVAEKGFAAISGDLDDGLLAPSLTMEPYYTAARLLMIVRETAKRLDEPRLLQVEHHAAFGLRVAAAPQKPPLGDAVAMKVMCQQIEMRIHSIARDELAARLMLMTESPRDRMRAGVQGVPQLKRTRDVVEKRARELVLEPPLSGRHKQEEQRMAG
ncbi:MAG: AIPR family protein [Neomegalonema sp.]|nr:AIPR family protein [Neomegalonema sp.]